jgi:hypothetical protein
MKALFILAALLALPSLRAVLGVADTSLVTVVANPADAAHWAAELDRLASQLAAANATLSEVQVLRAYAGDPRAAVLSLADLRTVLGNASALYAGGQDLADLVAAWQAQGDASRLLSVADLLARSGAAADMDVFGTRVPRDPSLYGRLAAQDGAVSALRSQVAQEQAARAAIAAALSDAWARLRVAGTESQKQAVLAEVAQLRAQDGALDARRRAALDDAALSDRADRLASRARDQADDEQLIARSGQLAGASAAAWAAADAQRQATVSRTQSPAAAADYSGIKVWTTADTSGP